jgi:hypothetical protein
VVNAALDSPPTPHRQRAMLDAVAVLLVRCAEVGHTFWGWTTPEWAELLGYTQAAFRQNAPAWVGDEVRPYLAAHAYLLGSFNDFHRLGRFQRLTLSWRIFGRDRVNNQISRIRTVLAEWGYQLGQPDDQLLPMVACQLFLLNRSPHLEDLTSELFEHVRNERLLEGTRLNTLHAMQRAVAALGICAPPASATGRRNSKAQGGPHVWQQWVDRWHATSTLTSRARDSVTCAAWIAATDRMCVGDYVQRTVGLKDRIGKPLQAPTKAARIAALRRFFRDCQDCCSTVLVSSTVATTAHRPRLITDLIAVSGFSRLAWWRVRQCEVICFNWIVLRML